MARAFSVKTVAFAIGVTSKWLDNLLSRHSLPGVARSKQGVERRINEQGLLAIEITRLLVAEFGIGLSESVSIARSVVDGVSDGDSRFVAPSGVALHFPIDRIQERLRMQILAAMEAVPNVSRGRPRRDRR